MKSISSALAQHLTGEVTTLATCWQITHRDGVVLGFTDHDRDLEVDGVSKLLRGRRGTEWAMSTHQAGEVVLVLDPATLSRVSSLDEVGLSRLYRAVSIGSDPSLPAAIAFTNEAASLKPYAPVHISGSRNGGGDLTITWVRRTRYSGEWRDLVDVPLNEASEAYEIDVLDGAGQAVRTLSSTSPSVVYPAADQATDFGAPQAIVDVAVYQLSAAVGRGFAGRASV
jgi:hypothetical protein